MSRLSVLPPSLLSSQPIQPNPEQIWPEFSLTSPPPRPTVIYGMEVTSKRSNPDEEALSTSSVRSKDLDRFQELRDRIGAEVSGFQRLALSTEWVESAILDLELSFAAALKDGDRTDLVLEEGQKLVMRLKTVIDLAELCVELEGRQKMVLDIISASGQEVRNYFPLLRIEEEETSPRQLLTNAQRQILKAWERLNAGIAHEAGAFISAASNWLTKAEMRARQSVLDADLIVSVLGMKREPLVTCAPEAAPERLTLSISSRKLLDPDSEFP